MSSNKKKNTGDIKQAPRPLTKKEIEAKKKAKAERKKKIITIVTAAAILLSVVLGITFCVLSDTGGACAYFETRNTEGHDLKYVKITTEYGKIVLLLDATTAPITVENFLKLTNEGFYDGLTFHRIMDNCMIQGGDPNADGTGGSSENIKGEFSANGVNNDISHIKGVISMARSNAYNSASSQFFICNDDASYSLDGKYAAFGYVIAGLDTVDKITAEGIKHTSNQDNGTIKKKRLQPVIESIVEITEKEAMKYAK